MEKLNTLAKKYNVTLRTSEDTPELGAAFLNVYMDVTSLINNLPPYVLKVEVSVGELYDFDENGEPDDLFVSFIGEEIEKVFTTNDKPSSSLQADAKSVMITLEGGYSISAWNSEWGGVIFS